MKSTNTAFIFHSWLFYAAIATSHGQPMHEPAIETQSFRITAEGAPSLHLQRQQPGNAPQTVPPIDVLYVHGATFPSDLSIFFRFDNRSWADALNGAGFTVWGFDFAGYGRSDRYAKIGDAPLGRVSDALPQLQRVIAALREKNGNRPIVLLAHSWGTAVAARYASEHTTHVKQLVLFGPPVKRAPRAAAPAPPLPPQYPLTTWAQYRRFVEDVPRGQAQVLSEAHFHVWSSAFLWSDPTASTRSPPSVMSPSGPRADIGDLWSGKALYDAARIKVPTVIVRGEWDSVCNDVDAATLLAEIGASIKRDIKIERATHLMHLETQRTRLYEAVNAFLKESAT